MSDDLRRDALRDTCKLLETTFRDIEVEITSAESRKRAALIAWSNANSALAMHDREMVANERRCVHYGDCPYHCECQEDEPLCTCKHRTITPAP